MLAETATPSTDDRPSDPAILGVSAGSDAPTDGRGSLDRRILAAARSAVERAGSAAGGLSERTARNLVRRTVERTVREPEAIDDERALVEALDRERTAMALSASALTLAAGKVARRVRPLQRFARRAPVLAAVSAIPEVYSSVADGLDDLAAITSYLTRRAGADSIAADPERTRRVALQVLAGDVVNADQEPDHDRLLAGWLRRSVRRLLPFSGRAGRVDAKRVARRAAAVDVRILAAPDV